MTHIVYLTKIVITVACIASILQDLKYYANLFKILKKIKIDADCIKAISSQIYSVILVAIMYILDVGEYELICLLATTITLTILHKIVFRPSYDLFPTATKLRIWIVSVAIANLLWLSPIIADPRLELFTRVIVSLVLTVILIFNYFKGYIADTSKTFRSWSKFQIVIILAVILLGHSSTDAFIRVLMCINVFNGVLGLQLVYKDRTLDNNLVQNIALLALFVFS